MDENIPNDSVKADAATNAVSIFGQAGTSDEFPVLKAFQQYIDAEQAKARKRMLGLSVFFIVLLVLVVGMFTIILTMMLQRNQEQADRLMQRNQEQADRLLELALRERQAPQAPVAPVVVNQPTQQQDALKPVLEQLANLASAIKDNAKPPPQPVVAQPVVTPTDAQAEVQRKLDAELQKLAEARAKLKADQEQARKEEVERQRRRLYPEYYAAQDRAAAAAAAAERALPAAQPTTLPAHAQTPVVPVQPAVKQPPVQPVIETPPVALPAAPVQQPAAPKQTAAAPTPLPAPEPSKQPVATGSDAAPSGTVDYVLPVGTKKTKGVKWRVPIPE